MQIRVLNNTIRHALEKLAKKHSLSINYVGNLCLKYGLPIATKKLDSLEPETGKDGG